MINRDEFKSKILECEKIADKYDLRNISKELKELEVQSENYKVNILLIGGYSAGKSALLNKFIGKSVLKENQAPETDIATELYFSENERIISNMLDGTKKVISSIEGIDINEVRNVEFYLNSENLKGNSDYIIVDTPGFDSGIEKHNKALMQYIGKATVFFLVVDCEKGTISESALRFMNEVSNYSDNIAVIINKCDKKIERDVYTVKEHIETLLQDSFGREYPIICTSIYDEDVDERLKDLILMFNSQELYEKNIAVTLSKSCEQLISALSIIKEKESCNTDELDTEIEKREKAKEKILQQIEKEKKRVGTKLHNNTKEEIVSKINNQLTFNIHELSEAYKGGIDLFQQRVVEIIRPIMINEMKDYTDITCDDFLKNINYESLNTIGEDESTNEIIKNVYDKLIEINNYDYLFMPLKKVKDDELHKEKIKEEEKTVYHALTSIFSIATDVIAPPLELIIVFLPEIARVVNTIVGSSKEKQLMDAIQYKIIPQIVSKISNELDKPLSEVEHIMIKNMESNIEQILDVENNALETIKQKRTKMQNDYGNFIENIDNDIENIREQVK